MYEGIYVALRKMSINSKSIYGDLSGLTKSIRMDLAGYVYRCLYYVIQMIFKSVGRLIRERLLLSPFNLPIHEGQLLSD